MSEAPAPFAPRAVLVLVLAGVMLFLALMWAVGQGGGAGGANNGGGHGGGKGVNGFAGFARLLAADGWQVGLAREDGALQRPGLLVLTPPADAPGKEIAAIVAARRRIGPTLVIAPKWLAEVQSGGLLTGKRGWVQLKGTQPPAWPGFVDDVTVAVAPAKNPGRWSAHGLGGALPDGRAVLSGGGPRLMPLVVEPASGRVLAALVADEGFYPTLTPLALGPGPRPSEQDTGLYPLVLVFEPDLLDNYGLRDAGNAALAEALARAVLPNTPRAVTFDVTLNGLALPNNLVRLALTPPYLAATLCLMLAALAVGWRAFVRFGPPLAQGRDIALGKAALVAHAGGLIVRSGRMRLLTGAYAGIVRERLARALGLPRHIDPDLTDAAIDRALAARDAGAEPFSETVRVLAKATREARVVAAARQLHDSARILTQ